MSNTPINVCGYPKIADTAGADERNALFGRVTDWMNEHRIPFDAQNELFRILSEKESGND